MDNQQPSVNNGFFYQKPQTGFGYIYKYTSPNGKSYIGQTINSLQKRAKNLISGNGYKKCSLFWKAIEKYGFHNFICEILEEVPIKDLNEKEIYYINKFNSCAPNGYNLSSGGEGGRTQDIYCYSAQNGDFLEHYESLSAASLDTGVPIETISTIINGEQRKQSHGIVFLKQYVEKYDINQLLRKTSHRVYVYTKNGDYYGEYPQIKIAAKELGTTESSIRKCLNGTIPHSHWYQFKNEKYDKINPIPVNSKTPISVQQICPETQEIIAIYPSIAAAARAVGLSGGEGIRKVIQRGEGISGGYFWKVNEGSTTKNGQNPSSSVRDPLKKGEDIV